MCRDPDIHPVSHYQRPEVSAGIAWLEETDVREALQEHDLNVRALVGLTGGHQGVVVMPGAVFVASLDVQTGDCPGVAREMRVLPPDAGFGDVRTVAA